MHLKPQPGSTPALSCTPQPRCAHSQTLYPAPRRKWPVVGLRCCLLPAAPLSMASGGSSKSRSCPDPEEAAPTLGCLVFWAAYWGHQDALHWHLHNSEENCRSHEPCAQLFGHRDFMAMSLSETLLPASPAVLHPVRWRFSKPRFRGARGTGSDSCMSLACAVAVQGQEGPEARWTGPGKRCLTLALSCSPTVEVAGVEHGGQSCKSLQTWEGFLLNLKSSSRNISRYP